MASHEQEPMECLVEEREAKMVAVSGSTQKPIFRKGMFLKTTCSNPANFEAPNPPPFLNSTTSSPVSNPLQIQRPHHDFRWWADPQFNWPLWVDKLKPKCTTLWKSCGIFDAIMESKYKISRDPSSLLGVSRFWSEETNTFVFPWGEATLTLEDVIVLGGFSVLGEPVRIKGPLESYLGDMESKMRSGLEELKKMHGKVDQSVWLRSYNRKGSGGEIEHVAFLSLWLSKFVLADSNERGIRNCVFQIAVRLANGVRIALAPAVLASIYRDIGMMSDYVLGRSSVLAISAPINLLQLWIWERFSALRLGSKNTYFDRPLSGRWNFSEKKFELPFVMSILKSPNEFKWRPYSYVFEQKHSMLYWESGAWFRSEGATAEGLQSFARCLRACVLVGLDCIEQYLPHRVAMQFGFDQEIPNTVPPANFTWELAWETYDMSSKNVKFYVPSQLSKVAVTLEYSNWWKGIGKKRKCSEHTLPDSVQKKVKVLSSETGDEVTEKRKMEEEQQLLDEFYDEESGTENKVANQLEETNPVGEKRLELDLEIIKLKEGIAQHTWPDLDNKEEKGLNSEIGEEVTEKLEVEEEEGRQILNEFASEESEAEKKVDKDLEQELEDEEIIKLLEETECTTADVDKKKVTGLSYETGEKVVEKPNLEEEEQLLLDEFSAEKSLAEKELEEELLQDPEIVKLKEEIASIHAKILHLESLLPESVLSSTT